MWMGGWVPIGYDRKDRTLTVNDDEAKTVRKIFELFLKLKNVRKVQAELARLKLTTKPYPISTGKVLGGLPFSRGHIYRILSNPLYIGEIAHRDSRLLNLALLSPNIVHQVLDRNPAATEVARREMTGQRLSALWREHSVSS